MTAQYASAAQIIRDAYLATDVEGIQWSEEVGHPTAILTIGKARFVLGDEVDDDSDDDAPAHWGWTWTTYLADGTEWDEQTTDSSQDEAEVRAALAAWIATITR